MAPVAPPGYATVQLIETTGEGKSTVATPVGKSRKKKKKIVIAKNCKQFLLVWVHGIECLAIEMPGVTQRLLK